MSQLSPLTLRLGYHEPGNNPSEGRPTRGCCRHCCRWRVEPGVPAQRVPPHPRSHVPRLGVGCSHPSVPQSFASEPWDGPTMWNDQPRVICGQEAACQQVWMVHRPGLSFLLSRRAVTVQVSLVSEDGWLRGREGRQARDWSLGELLTCREVLASGPRPPQGQGGAHGQHRG